MSKPDKLPSGRWRIRYFDADGKRATRTFDTFDLARSELRRLEVGVEETVARRERYGSEEMSVAEAWESYKLMRSKDTSSTARRRDQLIARNTQHYEHHIRPHLADKRLADLTPRVLREWIAVLAAKPTRRRGEKNDGEKPRTLAAATIRGVVTALRQIAKANDVPLVVLLAEGLKQKKRRARPRALQSIDDVRALVAGCREPWFRVAAAIACYAGARLGEVASLRWRHIGADAEGRATLTIALSWEGPLKARYEDDEEAARVLPLDPELAAILRAWHDVTGGGPDDRIVRVNGEPLVEKREDMAAKTRSACRRAGLAPLTFHALRASYATIAAGAGLPIDKLRSLLGHTDIETTAIYLRTDSDRARLDPRAVLSGHVLVTPPKSDAATLN